MLLLSHWKLGVAAALLAALTTVLLLPGPTMPIREAIAAGPAARSVVLQGRVVILRPNWFLLRDDSGSITLETCPVWYRWLPLQPGEKVQVQGEIAPRGSWRSDRPLFLVHQLRRENGVRISLRDSSGLPPWGHEAWMADLGNSSQRSAVSD